jgi:hypothetical protein
MKMTVEQPARLGAGDAGAQRDGCAAGQETAASETHRQH